MHVSIRSAASKEQFDCEVLVRSAFWDLYRPGCHEHYLWHVAMQGHPDVIEPLMLVAHDGNDIVGCVMSTRARVEPTTGEPFAVLAPGPLAVAPSRQRQGVGSLLLTRTLDLAREAGFTAAFLFGDPSYYHRFGFSDAAALGITTADGGTFPDFMALELRAGSLSGIRGRFRESPLFEFSPEAVEDFESTFSQSVADAAGSAGRRRTIGS